MRQTKTIVRFNRKVRDAESNLPAVRVSRGLSVVELVAAAKINLNSYLQLSTGEQAPIYINNLKDVAEAGDVKPAVKRILKVLKCAFADLFPRYACKLSVEYLTYGQISGLSMSEYSLTGKTKMIDPLETILSVLTDREKTVIEKTVLEDQTLQCVGDMLNVSRERIRQIQAKALRKLRHPKNRYILIKRNVA